MERFKPPSEAAEVRKGLSIMSQLISFRSCPPALMLLLMLPSERGRYAKRG